VKKTILLIVISFSFISESMGNDRGLTVSWFGTTCLNISDGKSALFFDPFITRPSMFQIVTFQKLKSDNQLIDKWLGKLKDNNIKALFVSHTHYDHVLDLVSIQKKTKAPVYGSPSVLNILKGAKLEASFNKVSSGDVVVIGDFKITIFKGIHPPHLLSYTLASGIIERPLSPGATAIEYKLGEVFSYLIEHPKGRVFFHPSGILSAGIDFKKIGKVDLLVQGIAKRESTQIILDGLIKPLNPKLVIPVHYDDFFEPLSAGIKELMTIDLDEFNKTVLKDRPTQKIALPKYGDELLLL
jgi:L-ascorbate metabolism protein UlaG (beta-lactamase superfamily)